MSLVQDIAILQRIPTLADFSDDQLRLLAFSAESVNYTDGYTLFDEGARADAGLVIAEGHVSLQKKDENGLYHEVETVSAGALLGETALLVETRHPARAICKGRVRIIRIRRALFKRMIQEFPELAARLFEAKAARYQETVAALRPVGIRLAAIPELPERAPKNDADDNT